MRLLLCCESYPPHRGGVQEVMRQIAERMVARGHHVTVATSRHPDRKSKVVNGVKVCAFSAGGKMVYGLDGQIDEYRQFVRDFEADTILIMAAQQWSFDALWPVLDDIKARKVFIPCGFSGLYEPDFAEYFRQLPAVLRKFDHFVFNAERYRDIDFVRGIGLSNFTVLPNGVSETEFDQSRDHQFRGRLGIPEDAFVFLTVGNPIEAKGHRDVIEAFSRLDVGGQPAVLISVAAWPPMASRVSGRATAIIRFASTAAFRATEIIQLEGWRGIGRRVRRKLASTRLGRRVASVRRYIDAYARRVMEIVRLEGWRGTKQAILRNLTGTKRSAQPSIQAPIWCQPNETVEIAEPIEALAEKASAHPLKRVILTDLNRPELVQAFIAADLFVFASRIEYSPLVLFEAAAAGTPFLTVPVGNATEIVRWTGGGFLCEAAKDRLGYTRVDPGTLAGEMARCMRDRAVLSRRGAIARERWRRHFTWQVVAGYYEDILAGKTPDVRITDLEASMSDEGAVSRTT